MNTSDIIEIIFLSAVIFFLLGYAARTRLPDWWQQLQGRFLPPRYLKYEGFWSNNRMNKPIQPK